MANVVGRLPVGADTRPLENDISRALSKGYQLKGLNEKAFSQPLGRITGSVDEFRKSLDASNARVLAFGASAGAIFAVQKSFQALISTTIQVQKNLTDINSILGLSTKNLSNFGDQLFKIASQTGQSFETVSQAAVEFSRQGLGVEETLKRTRDALILTRLSGLDVVASTQALTATINSFNKVALDSTEIVNKLATVDAAFAVSSGDLAEAISRVGSSADSVGVNLDQLVALVTSVQQTTARGGAVIGNSLKTIFTRLERTDVLDQLEALGIQGRNLDGSFKPAIDTLTQLAQKFDGLSDSQRANVAELVGGVFQINILKAALGDLGKQYSTYNSALNTSTGATDAAVKRNEQLNQTLSALINKTSANFTKFASDVGGLTLGPAIQGVLGNVNSALESFNISNGQGPGEKLAKGLLEGLGNYISGPGLALIGAVIGKLFVNLAKFSGQAVGQILDINKGVQQQAEVQQKINSILSQNPNLIQGILNKEISLLEVENQILGVIKAQTVAREQAAAVSATLTAGLIGRGVTSTGGKISAKSGGFIPNFSSPEQTEVYGAYLGGYKPGSVSRMNIPGEGEVVYNKAEQVKQFAGMSQPAIMPPQESSAGKNYAQAFQNKLGFNPYAAMGYVPNFAVFNANKHIQRGGFVGRSNKSTAEGLSNLTSLMGINYSGPITKQNLTQLFSSKENKKKLYEFLKKQPILIKQYPELYSEVKDGNHRFELAQLAGIKNIPAEYLAKGFIPNFAENASANRINSIATELSQNKNYQIPSWVKSEDIKKINQRVQAIKSNSGIPVKKQILDASGIATMLVPNGGLTSPFGEYSFDNGITVKWPVRTYGSRSETGIRSIYQEIEKGVAAGTKKYAASIKPPAFEPEGQSVIAAIKRTPGAAGALGAAAGAAFEVGMGLALGKETAAVEGVNFDVLTPNPELKKLFGYNTPLADFKINDSSAENRKSMAKKIISASGVLGKEIFSGNEKDLANRQSSVSKFVRANNLNKALGFIPNYSPLMASMVREMSAGVSPSSVRVGQDSRLSSSENPLGLGVYNTKDEPSGLGQGIARFKDIFAARKSGAARGFIPNYARRRVPFGQGGGALALSISAPIIGGAVSSAMSEDNVLGRGIAGGFGNVASYAATGAAVGGGVPGAIIGGLFGAVTTLIDIQKQLDEEPFKKLEKSIQSSQEKLNSLNDSFSKFNGISEKLNEVYTGNIKLSTEELAKLQSAQVATLASLPAETRNAILEALGKGDTLKVQQIQTDILETQQSKVKAQQAEQAAEALKLAEKPSWIDQIGYKAVQLGKVVQRATGDPTKMSQAEQDVYFNVNSASDFKKRNSDPALIQKQKDARETELKQFASQRLEDGQSIGDIIAKLSAGGAKPEEIRSKLLGLKSQFKNAGLYAKYIKDFDIQGFLDTAKKANQTNLIVQVNSAKVRDSAQKFLSALEENIATTNREFSESETKITNTISVLQSRRGILLESIKNLFGEFTQLDVSKQYDDAIRANEYQKSKLQITNKLNTETSTLGGGAVEAFRTSPSPDTNLIGFINQIGTDIESLKAISDPAKLKAESTRLANVYSEKASGGINGLVDEKAKSAASSFADQLRNLARSSDDLNNQMNTLNSTYKTSTQIAEEEKQARLQSLRLQQSLAFGGGINSLKSNDSRSRINSFNQNRFLMGSDNPTTSGRGALGAFQELQQFGIGPQSVNEDLKNKIVGGQAANLQKLASGFGIEINKQQALDIATKQFESISKTDENVEIIKTAVESISNNGIKIANPSQPGATQGSGSESGGVPLFKSKEANQDYLNTINRLQADASSQKMEQVFRQAITGQAGDLDIGKIKVSPQRSSSELIKDQVKAIQEKYVGEQAVLDLLNQSTSEYERLLTSSIDYNTGLETSVQYINDIDSILQQVNNGEMNVLDARQKINVLLEDSNTKIERSNKFITDQIEHTKDLKALADGYLTSVEYASKELERQQNAARKPGYNPITGAATNFVNEMSYNGTQFFQDLNTSAVDTARNIKSSFSNAFLSFINGTQTAGDAFKDFSIQILQQIQQIATEISTKLFMGAIFNQLQGALGGGGGGGGILSSLLGFSKGGLVKGYADGGYVNAGSGNMDDVPAMLSKGEFVLNKRAVRTLQQAYGSGFLHSINGGSARGMADGGFTFSKNFDNRFNVSGLENTKGLDTKDIKAGISALDAYINQLKGENITSSELSNFALVDPESIKNQERMQAEQDYYDYVNSLQDSLNSNSLALADAQKAYNEELDRYNRQKQQGLIGAFISAGMGIGGALISSYGGSMLGGAGKVGGSIGGSSGFGASYGVGSNGKVYSSSTSSPFLQNSYRSSSSGFGASFKGYASGGEAQDDIPALLMGGEFVVNKNAVKKYGSNFFEKLNRGQVKGFAEGGQIGNQVLGGNGPSLTLDSLTKAIADLQSSIENKNTSGGGDTNNITISINMASDGTTTESSNENNKTNNKGGGAGKDKDMREFTDLIKSNVITTIIEQKRPGGLLSKTSQS